MPLLNLKEFPMPYGWAVFIHDFAEREAAIEAEEQLNALLQLSSEEAQTTINDVCNLVKAVCEAFKTTNYYAVVQSNVYPLIHGFLEKQTKGGLFSLVEKTETLFRSRHADVMQPLRGILASLDPKDLSDATLVLPRLKRPTVKRSSALSSSSSTSSSSSMTPSTYSIATMIIGRRRKYLGYEESGERKLRSKKEIDVNTGSKSRP